MGADVVAEGLGIADPGSLLRRRLAAFDPASAEALRSDVAGLAAARDEVESAATDFEAYFLKMLLGEMRKTLTGDSLFESSFGDGYQSLMDDALARHAARAGGIGLADQLIAQWESRS